MITKKKMVLAILVSAAITFAVAVALVAMLFRPTALNIGVVKLDMVADGNYVGVCQNKIMVAVVTVKVENHRIIGIDVLEHKKSYRKQAEKTAANVLAQQALDVDAVSGATLTRDTVLKAIENALKQTP